MPTVPARKRVIVLDDDLGLLKAVGRLLTAQGVEAELFSSVQDFHNRAELRRAMCVVWTLTWAANLELKSDDD